MNFNESLEECRRLNKSLAMPESHEEHEILVEAMRKRKIGRMWIGVEKITVTGKDATYIDGRSVPINLLLWGEGQPNNSRGKQICVEMIASLKYLWNDFDCLYKSAFVCR
ncbi:collectin-10-like [Tropilaelaps mercedesae]|uniref:Collectin-10-like n=1 Tax=Tropilaelaps mercedesae TaxID=418985 RepID=A0A1V9XKE7_9ACAR|nr:collectin-10-like [Tropilaelaps mercedesae]